MLPGWPQSQKTQSQSRLFDVFCWLWGLILGALGLTFGSIFRHVFIIVLYHLWVVFSSILVAILGAFFVICWTSALFADRGPRCSENLDQEGLGGQKKRFFLLFFDVFFVRDLGSCF